MKTEKYKSLTYKISATREMNNVIKTNLKYTVDFEENRITPEKTLKIDKFIKDIDLHSSNLLKIYESNFYN